MHLFIYLSSIQYHFSDKALSQHVKYYQKLFDLLGTRYQLALAVNKNRTNGYRIIVFNIQ